MANDTENTTKPFKGSFQAETSAFAYSGHMLGE